MTATWTERPRHPKASRDVPVGTSWAFREHRNMAEIMAEEAAEAARAAAGRIAR